MLVLTRKVGQKLIISDNIEITVLEARGDIIKLGINAPKHIAIYREELYDEIRKSNQQAMNTQTSLDALMPYVPKKSTNPPKQPPL